jgi:hypothetical protein
MDESQPRKFYSSLFALSDFEFEIPEVAAREGLLADFIDSGKKVVERVDRR